MKDYLKKYLVDLQEVGSNSESFGEKFHENLNKNSKVTRRKKILPGRVAQSVTHLATDACLTADPGGREFDPGPVPYFRRD